MLIINENDPGFPPYSSNISFSIVGLEDQIIIERDEEGGK